MNINKRKIEEEFKVLRYINKNPQTNQREIAKDLGLSLGKLNYCLQQLKKKGLSLFLNIAYQLNMKLNFLTFNLIIVTETYNLKRLKLICKKTVDSNFCNLSFYFSSVNLLILFFKDILGVNNTILTTTTNSSLKKFLIQKLQPLFFYQFC